MKYISYRHPLVNSVVNFLSDPYILILVYILASTIRDSYGITLYIGFGAIAYVVYGNNKNVINVNIKCNVKLYLILVFAVLLGLFIKPIILNVNLPYDKLFQLKIAKYEVKVFPGWLFIIFYIAPFVLRRWIDQKLTIFNELRMKKQDWLYLFLVVIPLTASSFFIAPRPLSFLMGVQAFYLPGLWEELFYRGLILYTLLQVIPPGRAIVLSAIIFVGNHTTLLIELHQEFTIHILMNLMAIGILGLILGYLYSKTRNLLLCILVHGSIDGLIDICHAIGFGPINLNRELFERLLSS